MTSGIWDIRRYGYTQRLNIDELVDRFDIKGGNVGVHILARILDRRVPYLTLDSVRFNKAFLYLTKVFRLDRVQAEVDIFP